MKILKCCLDKTDMQYSVVFCLKYGMVKVNQFFHSQNFADVTQILIYILEGCLHLNHVMTFFLCFADRASQYLSVLTGIFFHY